jgi:DNA-binding LytR/AlgR family response regulator
MKLLLVDDEELQLLRLNNEIKKAIDDAEIFSYQNPLEALKECKDKKIDIAFLDIDNARNEWH